MSCVGWIVSHLTGLGTLALAAATTVSVIQSRKMAAAAEDSIALTKAIEKHKIMPYCAIESTVNNTDSNLHDYKRQFITDPGTTIGGRIQAHFTIENKGSGPAFNVIVFLVNNKNEIITKKIMAKEIMASNESLPIKYEITDYIKFLGETGVPYVCTAKEIFDKSAFIILEYKDSEDDIFHSIKPIVAITGVYQPNGTPPFKSLSSPLVMPIIYNIGPYEGIPFNEIMEQKKS
jgi:hypothetical protein